MKFGILKMTRDEYRKDYLCMRDYRITLLGIPIWSARFTTTNNDALRLLTVKELPHTHIKGFNTNNNETNNFSQKNK